MIEWLHQIGKGTKLMRDDMMFDVDGFDFDDQLDEVRRRVERKRNKEATNRLTKKADFSLYLEESGPLDLERELGFSVSVEKDWDN